MLKSSGVSGHKSAVASWYPILCWGHLPRLLGVVCCASVCKDCICAYVCVCDWESLSFSYIFHVVFVLIKEYLRVLTNQIFQWRQGKLRMSVCDTGLRFSTEHFSFPWSQTLKTCASQPSSLWQDQKKSTYKKKWFILAHDVSPWSHDPVTFGSVGKQ